MASNGDDTYDSLELVDANTSWQPIYVSMALAAIQGVFYLIVFEVARRNKFVESVYDRRRGLYESRMPPPLRKRSGLLNGWLAFEWWRFLVANKEYRKLSIEEFRTEKQVRRLAQNDKETTPGNRDDPFVVRAERHCFRESPYFDPFQEEEDDEIVDTEAEIQTEPIDTVQESTMENEKRPEDEILPHPVSGETTPTREETLSETISKSENGGSKKAKSNRGILRNRTGVVTSGDSPKSKSKGRKRSVLGLSESSSRRVRFDRRTSGSVKTPRSHEGDIVMGSEEAKRLAKLRYSQPAVREDWDKRSITAMLKFFKRKVLLMDTESGESQGYLAQDISRRPLNDEEQELLRCVGLDAFMTIRFLLFGFHVSLWPTILSLLIMLPIYTTGNGPATTGFFSTTVIALEKGSWKLWIVMLLLWIQFLYILRCIWTEWELFMPLRYDFLENGDFPKEKYKKQYRETALVEYVPSSRRQDKALFAFFDGVFPGQIRRAELLLNNEYMRKLIRTRLKHIVAYENVYAKKVHRLADYLRDLHVYGEGGSLKSCCGVRQPREPKEPMTIVVHSQERESLENRMLVPLGTTVKDARTYPALQYHHDMIQQLNDEIDSEYLRLAQEQRRPMKEKKKSNLARKLGLNYLIGSDSGRLFWSTAFVEFRSLAAKQQAIQCNIVGTKKRMVVTPVPEVRDLIWRNAHVPRALIEARRRWVNVLLAGCLVVWSLLVTVIRSSDDYSDWFNAQNPTLVAFINVYLPALLVEALVRVIPFLIKALCKWIRFKSASETDHYILCWYFCYRLFTFIFVIVGNDLVDQIDDLLDDPVGWLLDLSQHVAASSQFFICYVIITVTLLLLRLSQVHNVVVFFYLHSVVKEEALSQRRLERLRTNLKIFENNEFIPLFIFIFMIGALYGVLAPLSGIFVTGFFLVAYKVVRYMALFIYGNKYEGGGFLFYTLSTILFSVLYLIILVLAGYLFSHDSKAAAGIFFTLLVVTFFVHCAVHLTFVEPSRTLSLAKARDFDKKQDVRTPYQRKLQEFMSAKQALEDEEEKIAAGDDEEESEDHPLFIHQPSTISGINSSLEAGISSEEAGLTDSERRQRAVERLQRRYEENSGDGYSDLTDSDASGPSSDFFIYRQPSLNRATWEVAPRPYSGYAKREEVEVWQ